jgi:NTP pyrophosphatase (non-canonical NTP hydrolase)
MDFQEDHDELAKCYGIVDARNRRWVNGNNPFKIVARLCEETGEVAAAVNHFEDTGIKRQKHGDPDNKALAKEVMDVITNALAIARYYGIEQDLAETIERSYQSWKNEG